MSRSRRHTPITGNVGRDHGEQWFKRQAWHKVRRAVKMCLRAGRYDTLPTLRELSNPWGMPKDGKSWVGCADPDVVRRALRK